MAAIEPYFNANDPRGRETYLVATNGDSHESDYPESITFPVGPCRFRRSDLSDADEWVRGGEWNDGE